MALVFLRLHAQIFNVALGFSACYDLALACLIFRSGCLPWFLGVAGLGWLCYLWPSLATSLSCYVQPLGFLAELFLMLWLIVMGVGVYRWEDREREE